MQEVVRAFGMDLAFRTRGETFNDAASLCEAMAKNCREAAIGTVGIYRATCEAKAETCDRLARDLREAAQECLAKVPS